MSRIYFHSQNGDAEVRGSERAYMGSLVSDAALSAIGDMEDACAWLVPLLGKDCYVRDIDGRHRAESLRRYLRVGMGAKVHLDGAAHDVWVASLQTALDIGGDELKLCARLHGQCEIHCYVEGNNRAWLADIIERGRAKSILRAAQGWESVVTLLRTRADEPVVCSYSVCDQFPSFGALPDDHPLTKRDDDERWDEFYKMSDEEQWTECLRGVRERHGLELQPADWAAYSFDVPNFYAIHEAATSAKRTPAMQAGTK